MCDWLEIYVQYNKKNKTNKYINYCSITNTLRFVFQVYYKFEFKAGFLDVVLSGYKSATTKKDLTSIRNDVVNNIPL